MVVKHCAVSSPVREVGSDISEVGLYGLCSLTDPLLPDEEESEEDEFGAFDHFVGDVEIHTSWSFGFEEASAASDLAVGFHDDGLRDTVHKLKEVSEFDSEGG